MSGTEIYLVDEDQGAADSLRAAVESMGYTPILFDSAESFLESISDHTAESACVISDIRLPGMSGLELLSELSHRTTCYATIIVTDSASTSMTVQAIRLGALTVLDKPLSHPLLREGIEFAMRWAENRCQVHNRIERTRRRLAGLTDSEKQILNMLMDGKPNKAMAGKMNLSTRTIENRRRQLYEKMKAHSVPELVRMVVELDAYQYVQGVDVRDSRRSL